MWRIWERIACDASIERQVGCDDIVDETSFNFGLRFGRSSDVYLRKGNNIVDEGEGIVEGVKGKEKGVESGTQE